MKKLLLFVILLNSFFYSSAQDCVDFTPYTNLYLDSVTQDQVNFPIGSSIITHGDIQIVKIDYLTTFQGIQGDSALFYIGNLDIDVSSSNCTNKKLTFSTAYVEQMLVDGDTIYSFNPTNPFYQGNGFTVSFNGSGMGYGDFTIEGDFDMVRLLGSTNFLYNICLECLITTPATCIDFSLYDNLYLDSVTQDQVNFPIGSPIINQGDIKIVKIDYFTVFQFIQGDSSMLYIGNIDIDVSSSTCTNKKLTFNTAYVEQMIIDGDTIYSFSNTPAFYQGNGVTVSFNGSGMGYGDFIIEGDFDIVRLLGSTNFISNICLECLNESPSDCVDFTPYNNLYLDSVTQDQVNFPIGSPIITHGDIQIIKIDYLTTFQGIQGDSALFYIGNLDIDVSSSNCTNKKLTFSTAYVERMIIDGDTIYSFNPTNPFYQGNGFTVSFNGSGMGYGDFTIEGNFDVVRLLGSTNFLYNICLECLNPTFISEKTNNTSKEVNLFPNPTNGIFNLTFPKTGIYQIMIHDSKGILISTHQVNDDNYHWDLNSKPNGIYFINIISDKGWSTSKKIIKN
jgi:type IX secretion system substrate protein